METSDRFPLQRPFGERLYGDCCLLHRVGLIALCHTLQNHPYSELFPSLISFTTTCVKVARLFANNLTELDTTDYDVRAAMEEEDGIHLCRGIRYSLTMYLFHIADGWFANTRA